jgi:cell wall-associated NlpC family hydrolase
MLSFLISNVLICSNAVFGLTPDTLQTNVAEYSYLNNPESQSLVVMPYPSQTVTREEFIVELAPEPQVAFLGSQIVSQDLPASSSALVNSAMKYLGMPWDCTAVVEQGLRDLGYTVRDEAPMGFGAYGTVFADPSQVQPGDIMMRGGHVAIYAGNGMAIHGGWNGSVVVASTSPAQFYSFVRI